MYNTQYQFFSDRTHKRRIGCEKTVAVAPHSCKGSKCFLYPNVISSEFRTGAMMFRMRLKVSAPASTVATEPAKHLLRGFWIEEILAFESHDLI